MFRRSKRNNGAGGEENGTITSDSISNPNSPSTATASSTTNSTTTSINENDAAQKPRWFSSRRDKPVTTPPPASPSATIINKQPGDDQSATTTTTTPEVRLGLRRENSILDVEGIRKALSSPDLYAAAEDADAEELKRNAGTEIRLSQERPASSNESQQPQQPPEQQVAEGSGSKIEGGLSPRLAELGKFQELNDFKNLSGGVAGSAVTGAVVAPASPVFDDKGKRRSPGSVMVRKAGWGFGSSERMIAQAGAGTGIGGGSSTPSPALSKRAKAQKGKRRTRLLEKRQIEDEEDSDDDDEGIEAETLVPISRTYIDLSSLHNNTNNTNNTNNNTNNHAPPESPRTFSSRTARRSQGRYSDAAFSAGTAIKAAGVMDRVKKQILDCAENGFSELELAEQSIIYLPPELSLLADTLEVLNLERNYIVSLPPEIGALRALDSLQLFQNELMSLPPEIGMLTNLTRLFLNQNHLRALPPEIGLLTNLIWLSVDNNKIACFPPEIAKCTNLGWVSMESNSMESIPESIGQLTKLKSLSILDNPKLTTLPQSLLKLKTLSDFRFNQFFVLPKQLDSSEEIANYLKDMGRLDISFNPATVRDHWKADDHVSNCKTCNTGFSKITRRHHCRLCGYVFCNKCTSKRMAIPQFYCASPVRVCDTCNNVIAPPMYVIKFDVTNKKGE